jgi:hypothetical protein
VLPEWEHDGASVRPQIRFWNAGQCHRPCSHDDLDTTNVRREEIGVGQALLLAKLKPDQQERALAACFKQVWSAGGERPKRILLPVRSLQFWIESNILLFLNPRRSTSGMGSLCQRRPSFLGLRCNFGLGLRVRRSIENIRELRNPDARLVCGQQSS